MNQLRHIFSMLIILLFLPSTLMAQRLTVEGMTLTTDQTANLAENMLKDNNGDYAGLVKVRLTAPSASFEGMVLRSQKHNASEYWVFMAKNSTKLTVIAPGCLPLQVNFADYGIRAIESRYTYLLSINMPEMSNMPVDDGMRYLAMTVEPKNSMVLIDGQAQSVMNGEVNVLLMMGKHQYQVSAPNYSTKQGVIEIGDGKKVMTVKLESALSTVRVDCATAGAQIYVDGVLKGSSPWNGTLSPGNHRVEARHDGYQPQQQSLILCENENRTITIPALILIAGQLNVNYLPQGAEVFLDGKSLGTTPDVFRNIPTGSHRVEVRKKGYKPMTQTVTIKENEQASLNGTLTANTASADASAKSSVISGTSNSTENPIPPVQSVSSELRKETFTVNGVSFNMICVDGGTFMMGATEEQMPNSDEDETPVHQVSLTTYWIGETEVTQALWLTVMGSNPSEFTDDPNLPVNNVSWKDCQEFLRKLNKLTGKEFRLPTEAEWEYAARGGDKSKHFIYSGGNDPNEVAWFWENSGNLHLSGIWDFSKMVETNCRPHPVAMKSPNELGLFDMSGNVFEWCADRYGRYSKSPSNNPLGAKVGASRVRRGGGWGSMARYCRSADRNYLSSSDHNDSTGVRLALEFDLRTFLINNTLIRR